MSRSTLIHIRNSVPVIILLSTLLPDRAISRLRTSPPTLKQPLPLHRMERERERSTGGNRNDGSSRRSPSFDLQSECIDSGLSLRDIDHDTYNPSTH